MKFLLKYFGKTLKETQLEDGKEYLIGRHKECDFVLEEEAGLSRNHIKIYQAAESGNWIVESISELGGLYLDGEELDGVELEESISLTLKNYVLEFIKEEEEKNEEEKNEEDPQETLMEKLDSTPEESEEKIFDGSTKIFSSSDLIYSLYVYIDGEISNHVSLNEEESWFIGRSEDCDISIDYSVLTRKHLKITKTLETFYVEDLGSSNKTFLNNKELKAHKAVPLKANDEISVSDLKMVFEVRHRNFKQMMSNLPATVEEDSENEENLPAMAFSKVVLEEIPEVEENITKTGGLNKKIIIILGGLVLLGVVLYSKYESDKKKKQEQAERQKEKEHEDKLEVFYRDALDNLEQKRYQICIDQLEELHRFSSVGYFKDSQQIFIQCENGLKSQRQKEEYLAREETRKKTEEKIKKIAEKCKEEYSAKIIKTVEDLNLCAAELLEGLDPGNSDISAIRVEIEEQENLKLLKEQKQAEYRSFIQRKKALYNKAKKLSDQKKDLEAIAAYSVFLKSAKGVSALTSLYEQAQSEREAIQKKYDDELTGLHQSCENLIKNKKMKKAYNDCKRVLIFKSDDKKAKEYMDIAKKTLQKEFKSLYAQSMMDESFSRIEEAKKLWNEILDRDIKEGYYYKKALSQAKKYK